MIRNPYFWKIDTAGNQLPYIDGVESILVGDQEAKKLQVISGDADYIYGEMLGKTAETFALLKENEQRGGYTVISTRGTLNNQGTSNVNMAHDDMVLRDLFLEKDFRIALSLGLDRDEINQVIHRGAYIPSQVTPNTPFGNDEVFKLWMQAPAISWGVLLKAAQNLETLAKAPWILTPALAVVVCILSFNFVGDGVRDAADPYSHA